MLAFTQVALIRLTRDRTNVFWLLAFPLLLVLLLGISFGGTAGMPSVGLLVAPPATTADAATPAVAELEAALEEEGLSVELFADRDALESSVDDGLLDAGVVVAAWGGGPAPATIEVLTLPDAGEMAVLTRVRAAMTRATHRLDVARALDAAGLATVPAPDTVPDSVTMTVVDGGADPLDAAFAGLGQFDLGASGQLLLFVFITSLTGSTAVVQVRRWGVAQRVLTGPTTPWAVVAGLGLGQLAVALTQAVVIVVGTTVLFGVRWGDPLATGAVILTFSSLSAAAGLLLGSLLDNEAQASGIGVPLALVLAALGGSMVPLEAFPDTLRQYADLVPHTWANTAFAEIVRRDAGLLDVLPQLGVLTGFAVLLSALAAVTMRRRLAAGG